MKKAKNRYRIIMTGDMICLSLIVLVPLLIMLLGSFKNETEAQLFNLKLPTEWVFDNYSYVIIHGGIARAFLNSIIITVSVVVIVLISGSICAFVVSRRQNRYTKFVYSLFLAGMVAPLQIVTTFGLLKVLNLSGTYLGVILVTSAVQMPWAIFTLYGFIKSVPRELDEAAIIDGASPLRIFFQIVLPLLKPVIATVLIIVAMGAWNNFTIPLYFFNTSAKWTMPLTVYNFFGQFSSRWNYVFADLVLTALPITLLYLFCQKFVISGMTQGAVKG